MDSQRSVDIDRLRRDIEATRASISRTAGELRGKAGEAMKWQTYVERYPVPILGAAALAGVVLGRQITRGLTRGPAKNGDGRPWISAAAGMDSVSRLPARLEPITDRALLPALVGGVEAFLAGRVSRPAYRPVVPPQNRTSDPGMGEGSSR